MLGEKQERSWPALFPLQLHFVKRNPWCHLGTSLGNEGWARQRLSDPSRTGMGKGLLLSADVVLSFAGVGWAVLAPALLGVVAVGSFRPAVTPGRSYGSARKKLPRQRQLLGAEQTGQAGDVSVVKRAGFWLKWQKFGSVTTKVMVQLRF